MARGRGTQLEVARLQSEINRLFESLLRLQAGRASGLPSWSPGVDVAESETHLVVEVEVPGVDAASMQVSAHDGNIVMRGTRLPSSVRLAEHAEVLLDEREYGAFERTVPLSSPVNTHLARAVLKNGVLRIELPKVENRRGAPVTIPVTAE